MCHMHSRVMHLVASVCNVIKTFLPLINHRQSLSAGCSQVLEPSMLWIKCWICLSIDVMWSPVTPQVITAHMFTPPIIQKLLHPLLTSMITNTGKPNHDVL